MRYTAHFASNCCERWTSKGGQKAWVGNLKKKVENLPYDVLNYLD